MSEKKKRGRKPKSDKNSKSNDAPTEKQYILHLNSTVNTKTQNDSRNNYEKDFCKYNPEIEIPNAFDNNDTFMSQPFEFQGQYLNENGNKKNILNKISSNEHTNIACLWCCHHFDTPFLGLPIRYKDNSFEVYGTFCGFECMCAYNFYSNELNLNTWEIYNLINLMANKMNYAKVVQCAPPRKHLQFFGGSMSIEDFRNFKNSSNIINVNVFPLVSVIDQIEEINDFNHKNQTDFFNFDKERLQKYEEKINKKTEDELKSNFKNTLNASMNINKI
jgi:hypothetical protein